MNPSEINDIRSQNDFKGITFSNYKRRWKKSTLNNLLFLIALKEIVIFIK